MNKLWKLIDQLSLIEATKFRLFRIILEIIFGLLGFIIWLITRNFFLNSTEWMVCFIGFPMILAIIISLLYYVNHQ